MPSSGMAFPTKRDWLSNWFWYLGALAWIICDQWTKWLADNLLQYARPQEVLWFFDLTLLYNPGAAFSFLSDAGGWQKWMFSAISAIVSVFLVLEIPRQKSFCAKLALAMILSGAIGNLIDRLRFGYVIDFIHLHWQNHYFPAFNLADAAISVGVCFLLVDWFLLERKRQDA